LHCCLRIKCRSGLCSAKTACDDSHPGLYPSRKLAMFGLGLTELLVLAFIMLILFGNRLPGMMRSLGQGVVEFKRGVQGIDDDTDDRGAKSTAAKSTADRH
jgi:sec-independent protein translocase protein TatA